MARILIAWELGEAYGHLARCLRLADSLRLNGHSVVLVLKDIRLPAGYPMQSGHIVLPAPLSHPARTKARIRPINYADVLRHSGFAEAQDLVGRLVAWQGIFNLARPDLLVADHAPTALLVAHLAELPHLAIGNGFAIPPATAPWPSIRPWDEISEADLLSADRHLHHVTGAALKAVGYSRTLDLRVLFGRHDILDTFCELDHYGPRSDVRYVGPIVSIPRALCVTWQRRKGVKILAYLRPSVPGFPVILQALSRLNAEVLCIAPGLSGETARRLASQYLRISVVPVDLAPLLDSANLAISYGNGGFSTQALLAGVPLWMRPHHVEQALLARQIQTLGAGKAVTGGITLEAVVPSLQSALDSNEFRQAACNFSARYRNSSPEQALEKSLSYIEQALLDGWGGPSSRQIPDSNGRPQACQH